MQKSQQIRVIHRWNTALSQRCVEYPFAKVGENLIFVYKIFVLIWMFWMWFTTQLPGYWENVNRFYFLSLVQKSIRLLCRRYGIICIQKIGYLLWYYSRSGALYTKEIQRINCIETYESLLTCTSSRTGTRVKLITSQWLLLPEYYKRNTKNKLYIETRRQIFLANYTVNLHVLHIWWRYRSSVQNYMV